MKERLSKRFYKTASIAQSDGAHAVLLDGKPARIGSAHLDPDTMRLTGLAGRALNRVATHRGDVVEHILGFGRNESLCYRAAEPPELVARQKTVWDLLLEWAHRRHGIRLVSDCCGISFIEQPVDAPLRMQEIVSGFSDFELAAFDAAASFVSSFVIALALIKRHIGAEQAFGVSHLDELYQAEKWGCDAEAECRRACIVEELKAVERFMSLLSNPN